MDSILRLPQVLKITGISKSSIYAFMEADKFPKSISLGERSVGWIEGDIQKWIEARIEISRKH